MDEPIGRPGVYVAVFVALVILTLATVGATFLDLGPWHTAVGFIIATAKGWLVALFFMHLLHANRLILVSAGVGLFWLSILMSLTLTDYVTRHWQAY